MMAVTWGDYWPFDPRVDRPLHEVSRREARAAFKLLMDSKCERIEELRRLLALNGIELRNDDEGIQRLNDWFRAEVAGAADGRLEPYWYAIVNDLALFLGDAIIERAPNLKWVMHEWGKRDYSYQRHVISGFTKVAIAKYTVDIDILLAGYGVRIVTGENIDPLDCFLTWVRTAVEEA